MDYIRSMSVEKDSFPLIGVNNKLQPATQMVATTAAPSSHLTSIVTGHNHAPQPYHPSTHSHTN